jgi:hypothetical protein
MEEKSGGGIHLSLEHSIFGAKSIASVEETPEYIIGRTTEML